MVAVVRLAALVLGVAAVDLLVVGPKLSWQKTSHRRLAPPGTSRHFPWAVATRAPSWSSRRRSRSRLRPQHGQPRCAPPRKPQSHDEDTLPVLPLPLPRPKRCEHATGHGRRQDSPDGRVPVHSIIRKALLCTSPKRKSSIFKPSNQGLRFCDLQARASKRAGKTQHQDFLTLDQPWYQLDKPARQFSVQVPPWSLRKQPLRPSGVVLVVVHNRHDVVMVVPGSC